MIDKPAYYDLALYLAANDFGTLGTDIFAGEWGSASKQLMLLNGVGVPSDVKDLYENPGIQIFARGDKREADHEVYSTAKEVSDFILALADNIEINGVCYTGFEPTTNIANLGKDDNERFIYSMNFTTFRNRI